MNAKPTKTTPQITKSYADRRGDIARLLDVLGMELDKHAERPATWGGVADLAKVRSDLIEIVGFMSGMDRDEVERFLAE